MEFAWHNHKFAYPGFAASPASCTNLLTRPYQCRLLRGSRRSALVCSTNDNLAADFVVIVINLKPCAAWHSPQFCVNLATAPCCDVHRFKGPSNRQPLNICRDQLSQGLIDEFTHCNSSSGRLSHSAMDGIRRAEAGKPWQLEAVNRCLARPPRHWSAFCRH